MRTYVLSVSLLMLTLSSVSADTFIVDPLGGGDSTTIQGGLDLASAGDEVQVLPGAYPENVTMTSGVRLESSWGAAVTTINGNGGICINCEQCVSGTMIRGFTLTGGGGYVGGGVRVYDFSHVEICGNIIVDNHTSYEAAGIVVQRYSTADIHDNQFLQNTTLYSCAISVIVYANANIQDNLFKDNTSTALSAGIGIDDAAATITGNIFIQNHSVHGATVHVHASAAFVANNSFLFNDSQDGASGLFCYGGSTMTVEDNIVAFNSGAPGVNDNGAMDFACNVFWENGDDYLGPHNPIGSNDNVHVDPQVCAPLSDDASLSLYSPCLNSPVCGTIGANPVPACSDVIATESVTWGFLKGAYR